MERNPGRYTFVTTHMELGLPPSWATDVDHFRAWLLAAGQSLHTIKLRIYYLRRFAARVEDPWTATLDDLATFLAHPGWRAEARKSARAALRAFYGWGHVTGRVAADLSRLLPPVKVPRGVPHPTPDLVFARALAAASDRDALMMMCGAYAGLRRTEIAHLRFADVGDAVYVRGKGARERMVPTHTRLRRAVDAELELRAVGLFGSGHRYGDPASPWIFPGRNGGAITPGAVGKVLSRRLGDYSGHTLRHRFATRAHEATKDMRAVQELLGHSSLVTTQRYVAVSSAVLRAAVDAA